MHCDCLISTSALWRPHHRNIRLVIWFSGQQLTKSRLFQHQCPNSWLFQVLKNKTWISGLFRTRGNNVLPAINFLTRFYTVCKQNVAAYLQCTASGYSLVSVQRCACFAVKYFLDKLFHSRDSRHPTDQLHWVYVILWQFYTHTRTSESVLTETR